MLSKKESKKFIESNIDLSNLDGTIISMKKYGITKLNLIDKKLISSVVKNVANKKFLKIFKDVVEDDIDINQTIKILEEVKKLEQDLISKKDYIDLDEFVKFRNQLKKIKDLLSKKYNYEKSEKNKSEKKKKELEEILYYLRQEKEKEEIEDKEGTKGKAR
jgi:hypothetical protein